MVMEYLEKAWKIYRKNLSNAVVPYLIVFILSILAVVLAVGISFSVYFFTNNLIFASIIGIIFVIPAIVISVALKGGYLAVVKKSFKVKNGVSLVFDTAKKKWKDLFITSILLSLIYIAIYAIPTALLVYGYIIKSISIVLISLLLFIPGFFLSVFFVFPIYAVIFDNKKPVDSIKISIKTARRNYWNLAGVMILLGIIGGVLAAILSLIPFGSFIFSIFFAPYAMAVYALYYTKNKRR